MRFRSGWFVPFWLVLMVVMPRSGASSDAEYAAGVRTLGMAGADVAAPGRASAVSRNLAAVASMERYAAEASTANLFGLLRANYVAAVLPFSERRAVGFDWFQLRVEDSELGFAQNRLRLGYAFRPTERLSLGLGLSYRTQRVSLDAVELGAAAGWSTDLGVLWDIPHVEGLTFGLSVRNWLSSTSGGRFRSGAWVRVEDGPSQRIVPRTQTWGLGYRWGTTLIAAAWSEGFHLGVERPFGKIVTARAGFMRLNGEGFTFSVGGTARWRWGSFDYAFVVPPDLAPTSYFGLAFGVSYRVPPVVIDGVAMADLYVALREYYARPEPRVRTRDYEDPSAFDGTTHERIGEIWLRNPSDRPVRVSVRAWMERFTSRRGTETVEGVEIGPGERVIVPMQKLLLSDAATELTRNRPVEVRIEIADIEEPSRRRAFATTTVLMHGRNEMRFDDLAKLGAFISSTDRTVREFATRTLRSFAGDATTARLPSNLRNAIVLFSALREIGYQSDPNLPRESGTIDAIKYPAEFLEALLSHSGPEPFGDCDDSTVLVASLLEAAGVPTALIQTPRHVLMAFDLGGVSLEEAQQRGIDDLTIGLGGYAWIPLETTVLRQGFGVAWAEGLRQVRGGVLDSVTTRAAWDRYGTAGVEFPYRTVRVPAAEVNHRVAELFADRWFRTNIEKFLDARP